MGARLAALLLATAVAAAAGPSTARADLDQRLQGVVDALTADVFVGNGLSGDPEAFYVPGAALSVDLPGEPTRTYVAGAADVAAGTPMSAGAVQPIGSGTKPMTAALVIDLVRDRKLRLADPLVEVARDNRRDGGRLARLGRRYRARLRGVTIRELLSMTSGLRDYDDDPAYVREFARSPRAGRTLPRLAELGLARSRLFPPGKPGRSFYSNTNYILLGMVIEAITGRGYEAVLERFLARAGLDGTSYGRAPGQTAAPEVHGYANPFPTGGPALLGDYRRAFRGSPEPAVALDPAAVRIVSADPRAEGPTVAIGPPSAAQEQAYGGPAGVQRLDLTRAYSLRGAGATAGAVVSNTEDLARFWRGLFSGDLLGRRGLRLMLQSVPGDPGSAGVRNYFTLGLARQDVAPNRFWPGSPRLRIWMKLGDIWGYTSASYYVRGPAPYGGVVVTNTTNMFPSPVGDLGVLRQSLLALAGCSPGC